MHPGGGLRFAIGSRKLTRPRDDRPAVTSAQARAVQIPMAKRS